MNLPAASHDKAHWGQMGALTSCGVLDKMAGGWRGVLGMCSQRHFMEPFFHWKFIVPQVCLQNRPVTTMPRTNNQKPWKNLIEIYFWKSPNTHIISKHKIAKVLISIAPGFTRCFYHIWMTPCIHEFFSLSCSKDDICECLLVVMNGLFSHSHNK